MTTMAPATDDGSVAQREKGAVKGEKQKKAISSRARQNKVKTKHLLNLSMLL
jgi:hypothetical protein